MLLLRTHAPQHGADPDDGGAHDGGVLFPVGGLGIPPAGRRPDVFGIAGTQGQGQSLATCSAERWRVGDVRNLPATAPVDV